MEKTWKLVTDQKAKKNRTQICYVAKVIKPTFPAKNFDI